MHDDWGNIRFISCYQGLASRPNGCINGGIEFIKNAFDWINTDMFPPKTMEILSTELKKRVALAKELGLEHFDISMNVQFISKEGQPVWAYYVSYYNLEDNILDMYIKFLDEFINIDPRIKN